MVLYLGSEIDIAHVSVSRTTDRTADVDSLGD